MTAQGSRWGFAVAQADAVAADPLRIALLEPRVAGSDMHGDVLDPVAVGVGGSDHGWRALDWAAQDAARRGSSLRVLHAGRTEAATVATWFRDPKESRSVEALVLAAARSHLAARSVSGPRVESVSREGPVVPVLLDELRTSSLLVLGRRGLGVPHVVAGRTSIACAVRADRPVVLVPSGWADPDGAGGLVVVGVDGEPHDCDAIWFAADEASQRGAVLEVVHLWRGADADAVLSAMISGRHTFAHEPGRLLLECVARCRSRYPDVLVVESVERTQRVGALIRRSAYATLLVVGGSRHVHSARTIRFTARAARQAMCPVAVVYGVPTRAGGAE